MRERLVEQHHLGPTHQGARQGDPLTLTGGELDGGAGRRGVRRSKEVSATSSTSAAVRLRSPRPTAKAMFSGDRELREQHRGLEHHRRGAPLHRIRAMSRPADAHRASREALESSDASQQRGLPRARRADHGDHLPGAAPGDRPRRRRSAGARPARSCGPRSRSEGRGARAGHQGARPGHQRGRRLPSGRRSARRRPDRAGRGRRRPPSEHPAWRRTPPGRPRRCSARPRPPPVAATSAPVCGSKRLHGDTSPAGTEHPGGLVHGDGTWRCPARAARCTIGTAGAMNDGHERHRPGCERRAADQRRQLSERSARPEPVGQEDARCRGSCRASAAMTSGEDPRCGRAACFLVRRPMPSSDPPGPARRSAATRVSHGRTDHVHHHRCEQRSSRPEHRDRAARAPACSTMARTRTLSARQPCTRTERGSTSLGLGLRPCQWSASAFGSRRAPQRQQEREDRAGSAGRR